MTEGKISKGRMTSKVVGPDGEEQTITSDEQTTFYVPAKSVENYLKGDVKGKGIPVDEQYREAERRNAERGGGKTQQPNKTQSQTQVKKYSADIEKKIQNVINKNPGSSREEVINALIQAGKLK